MEIEPLRKTPALNTVKYNTKRTNWESYTNYFTDEVIDHITNYEDLENHYTWLLQDQYQNVNKVTQGPPHLEYIGGIENVKNCH